MCVDSISKQNMNFEKSLLNVAFCSVPGGRSNVTYFGKLDPGDLGLLYSRTCWVLLLVLKEGEILQCHPCDRKSWHFQLLVIFIHFIFTNLVTHSAWRNPCPVSQTSLYLVFQSIF